jgi:hypothetical protein
VVYVFLDEHDDAELDEEFDLTDYLLEQWEADFAAYSSPGVEASVGLVHNPAQ